MRAIKKELTRRCPKALWPLCAKVYRGVFAWLFTIKLSLAKAERIFWLAFGLIVNGDDYSFRNVQYLPAWLPRGSIPRSLLRDSYMSLRSWSACMLLSCLWYPVVRRGVIDCGKKIEDHHRCTAPPSCRPWLEGAKPYIIIDFLKG